ncbi:FAD-linked sulfhydryl oxidase ALR [Thrips palmi]|uniref:Sulfhydryl oxidase n=1 Tax=Thrips palmi TaxID=161013 RepID=A0A6P9A1V2_THRPL|nr:FAD-linked sulfhydryl oxidase ALR [Thrips palmi]XP_034251255.1 FAD-linked sulfhydryl oxidase ALR [Thrips palmi]XP_034251256.1 FAD-linked sulfhydryl oxidase ALR [Thrips palmi]
MAFNFGSAGEETNPAKPCRTCTDFKTWAKQTKQSISDKAGSAPVQRNKECPLDKDELGKNTWGFLHTMAAYYPDNPTPQQKNDMKSFFNSFSQFYPCEVCAKDFQQELRLQPPNVENQKGLTKWLCDMHNIVNVKLGKQSFDCNRVNERWKDGWLDGSCN